MLVIKVEFFYLLPLPYIVFNCILQWLISEYCIPHSYNIISFKVKQAYYKLSKEYHPDQEKGSAEKFRLITEAYEILSNIQKRKLYDKGFYSPTISATAKEADNYSKAARQTQWVMLLVYSYLTLYDIL